MRKNIWNKRNVCKRIGAAMLAGTLLAGSTATAAFADTAGQNSQSENNTDITNDLINSDVIDVSESGSLSIYKYDFTAASEAGAYSTEGGVNATGKADATLQSALAQYAIKGVEFTYLWVGDIEQYSITTGTGTQLNLVYEIPEKLAALLGLADEDGNVLGVNDSGSVIQTGKSDTSLAATDMTDSAVSTTCDKEGYLHYTSDQISTALKALLEADDVAAKDALEDYVISLHDDSEPNVSADTADSVKNDHTKSHTLTETDSNGYTYADGLDLGLYLVVETAVPENVTETVNPFFVSIPMTNETSYQYTIDDDGNVVYETDSEGNKIAAEDGGQSWFYDIVVYPKNQTGNPTLDKMVRNATGDAASAAGVSEGMEYIVTNLTDSYSGYGAVGDLDGDGQISANDFALQRGDGTYSTTNNGVNAIAGATDEQDADGNYDTDNVNDGTSAEDNGTLSVAEDESVSGEYEYSSTTTASSGDILDYILVSKLPHISSTATYLSQYMFEDYLSAGLTYNDDIRIAFYTSAADAYTNNTVNAVSIWTQRTTTETTYDKDGNPIVAITEGDYDVAYLTIEKGANTGRTKLTVDITEQGLALINGNNGDKDPMSGYSDYYMVVYYTATADSDGSLVLGDEGNENDVTLTWSRSNMSYYDTLDDKCIVYAYGVDLTKVFSDDKGTYSDVTFNLYNRTDGYYVTASYNEADGAYYVTGKSASQDGATVFVVNDSGKLIILGLEGDVYGLAELSTTSGYSLLADEITIDITAAYRSIQAEVAGWTGQNYAEATAGDSIGGKVAMVIGDLNSGSATVDGILATMLSDSYMVYSNTSEGVDDGAEASSANAIVKLVITNTSSFTLPLTGGAGLYLVTILGVAAVAAGCRIAFGKRKDRKESAQIAA